MNKYLFLLIVPVILLAGCTQENTPPATSEKASPQPTVAVVPAPATQQPAEADDFFAPQLKGQDIYCHNEKVGKLQDGRIYMKIYGKTVSVEETRLHGTDNTPDISELSCIYESPLDKAAYVGFSYYGLEISPHLYPPYAVYQTIETPEQNQEITYKCDGSLVKLPKSESGADFGIYTKNAPNYYCETNGQDYLTQYEFQGASGYPILTTGGEYGEQWSKIYIKKQPGLNYFFLASISFDPQMADVWFAGDSQEKYQQLIAKSYLDELLKNPQVTQSQALWDTIVKSFRVEPEGAII
jgi:hypothetical protein